MDFVRDLAEGKLSSARPAFSLGVQDFLYSIPQSGLFDKVRHTIEASGEVAFQNTALMSAGETEGNVRAHVEPRPRSRIRQERRLRSFGRDRFCNAAPASHCVRAMAL
ncbi:hypothetical protein HPB50_002616 [Hyalomma asiaticum]|uniref:Uncharacterized protein n=1 Tax=Hyalomma asiaticum TaxID=266040 RepID=A0ACB7TBA4_HYAAI|nr:hypothetical protein HPB50_002616 [Hyalomma asiaticum]